MAIKPHSRHTKNPRAESAPAVSAWNMGIEAMFIPFPTPVTTRPIMNWAKAPSGSPVFLKDVTYMTTPMMTQRPPRMHDFFRPSLSPSVMHQRAPSKQPISYTATTKPNKVGLWATAGKLSNHRGVWMTPDMTPLYHVSGMKSTTRGRARFTLIIANQYEAESEDAGDGNA